MSRLVSLLIVCMIIASLILNSVDAVATKSTKSALHTGSKAKAKVAVRDDPKPCYTCMDEDTCTDNSCAWMHDRICEPTQDLIEGCFAITEEESCTMSGQCWWSGEECRIITPFTKPATAEPAAPTVSPTVSPTISPSVKPKPKSKTLTATAPSKKKFMSPARTRTPIKSDGKRKELEDAIASPSPASFKKIRLTEDLDTSIFLPEDCPTSTDSCCLSYNDEVCGGSTRGSCEMISGPHTDGFCDLRDFGTSLQWITDHYDYVCVCGDHFSGAACEECAFGWSGDDCSVREETRVRYNFDDLTTAEQDRVIAAFVATKTVQAPYQSSLSSWDWFAGMHYWGQVNSLSTGMLSVNWHRMMILALERLMQKAMNDATFSLPYWDWSRGDNENSATLTAVCGNGDLTSEDCDGCFCPLSQTSDCPLVSWHNIGAYGVADDSTIGRSFGCNTPFLPSRDTIESVVALTEYCGDSGFQALAADMHAAVHHWVGGTMSTAWAASDPLFFLHHCHVDLIFTRWIMTGENAGYSQIDASLADSGLYSGGDACMAGFFPLVSHRTIWVADTRGLGYTYDVLVDVYDTTETSDSDADAEAEETTTTTSTTTTTTTTATSSAITTSSSLFVTVVVSLVGWVFSSSL